MACGQDSARVTGLGRGGTGGSRFAQILGKPMRQTARLGGYLPPERPFRRAIRKNSEKRTVMKDVGKFKGPSFKRFTLFLAFCLAGSSVTLAKSASLFSDVPASARAQALLH